MTKIALLFLGALVAVSAVYGAPSTKYTTKYDNIDVNEILNNDRLLNSYYKCLMEDPGAKCTADGAELKKILPDAIKTKCEGCSEKQKEGAEIVVRFMYEKKPDLWKNLEEKYDPDHIFRNRYKEEAEKRGIKLE